MLKSPIQRRFRKTLRPVAVKELALPVVTTRITDDGAEKWFEVGFTVAAELIGGAADGWVTGSGVEFFKLQRSEDLVNWDETTFVDCAVTGIDNGDGTFTYWARSIYPMDSKVKTGVLPCSSTVANGNVNNNPINSVTIGGVTLSLPNQPYTLPGDAAQFQTDLAAIYPGATVTASSATVWEIYIPGVAFTSYTSPGRVNWTSYAAGTDPITGATFYSNGRDFDAQFINSAGVRTAVRKQFARLKHYLETQTVRFQYSIRKP